VVYSSKDKNYLTPYAFRHTNTRGRKMSKLILEKKLETFTRGQMLWLVIFFVIALILVLWLGSSPGAADYFSLIFLLGLIYFVAPASVILLISWLKTFTTARVFDDRFEIETTFLVKTGSRIEASKIESVDFSESLLGRSRYGSLVVRGAGTRALQMIPIRDPEEIAEVIRGIADKSSSKQAKSTSDGGSGDTQSLAELIKMKEQGHLTDTEFTAAKKKLLG